MDAIFHIALTNSPWAALPSHFGRPDTVAKYFRRLTHAGLWQKLLHALAQAAPSHPLRGAEYFILRATRRAHRILGLPLIALIRRIGLRTALPGPPWLLPDPLLSETLSRIEMPPYRELKHGWVTRYRAAVAALKRLQAAAAGRARISRSVRLGWP
jgi:transposase